MEGELEFLKIIAELSIFLMSITVPTYAIAISHITRTAPNAFNKIKEKREKLEKELKKDIVREKIEVQKIENKIKRFRKDEKKIKTGLKRFSWKGVILYPSVFFGLALTVAAHGIYFYPAGDFIIRSYTLKTYIPSLLFIFIGILLLGRAIIGIENASIKWEILEDVEEKSI